MVFGKKKGMIDIGELHKEGKVLSPDVMTTSIPTNSEGFVEVGNDKFKDKNKIVNNERLENEKEEFYNKRDVDAKIIELDNTIYKLEQRIEVLERKAGVGMNNSNVGVMGW